MDNLALIQGDDKEPHLDSPFGHFLHRPRYKSIPGGDHSKRDLIEEEKLAKARQEETESLFSTFKLTSCKQALQENVPRLSTGCRYINEFLNGGIRPQKLTEIFGEGATGKTQMVIQLLLNSILPVKLGGMGGKACCIFTSKHVSEKRYNEMKECFLEQNIGNITEEEVDKKIKIQTAFELPDFNEIFDDFEEKVKEEDIRCVIIDNIASLCDNFTHNEMGVASTDYIERSTFLHKTASTLKKIAYKYNIVVITINNVVADMGMRGEEDDPSKNYTEKFRGGRNAIKPSLGLTWTSLVNDRICLKRTQHGSNNFTRKMMVDQSAHWPHVEMQFEIDKEGLKGRPR